MSPRTNRISPGATLLGEVSLGSGNVVETGAVLLGPLDVGHDNFFGPHCVVGTPAEDDLLSHDLRKYGLQAAYGGSVRIGSRNVIREFVTVHRGLTGETVIGDDCYIMARSHVAHDCDIRDAVKIATNVQIGGYSWIGRETYLGLSASLHQFVVVGGYSMVGMGSILTRITPPGSLLYGNPARLVRPNAAALQRLGVSRTDWWEGLRDGDSHAAVPAELAKDFAEFEAAVGCRVELRASVTAWRSARREAGGGG